MIQSVLGVFFHDRSLSVERKNLKRWSDDRIIDECQEHTSKILAKAFIKTAKNSKAPLRKKLDVSFGKL